MKLSFAPVAHPLPSEPVTAKTAEPVSAMLAAWLESVLNSPDSTEACIMVNRPPSGMRECAKRVMQGVGEGAYGPNLLAAWDGRDGRVSRGRILVVPVKAVGEKTIGGTCYIYHVSAEKYHALAAYALPRE
jgi:hypothetical protein